MNKKTTTLLSVLLLLIIWEAAARIVGKPELFPTVVLLIKSLVALLTSPTFYLSAGMTIARGLTGIILSITLAGLFAALFARYRWLYELFRPILSIMRSVPVISFILLALIFLNPESIPLLIAFLVMFPLLTENLTKGLLHLHPGYRSMAYVFAVRRRNNLLHIVYPQLRPFVYSGLTSAMGFGWRAIIMGEVLAQCALGIGGEMKRAQTFIEIPELLAWTIVAILISYLFDKGIGQLEKYEPSLSWSRTKRPAPESDGIRIEDLSFSYDKDKKEILSHFSQTFEKGKIYGISAPSGMGKTTLLKLISGVLRPDSGSVRAVGGGGTATVFQEPELLPQLSARDNILLPLTSYFTQDEAVRLTDDMLSQMEMESYKDVRPPQLSYGQQQRIAIARALLFPSPLLLMDEPFKGLDTRQAERIISSIRKRQAEKQQTILFATHNPKELTLLADQVLYL